MCSDIIIKISQHLLKVINETRVACFVDSHYNVYSTRQRKLVSEMMIYSTFCEGKSCVHRSDQSNCI